ncbi:MAG: FliH/SctL family protein [Phycisphaeraceae bacterium]
MPLLKSHDAAPLLKEAIVLDLGDLGRQAARLRAAAEAKAAQILDDAEREARTLIDSAAAKGREQGHAEGHAAGLAEGREQGRREALEQAAAQFETLQQTWADALRRWEAHCDQVDREARQGVLNFALKVAEKLVHRTIEVDERVVVGQLAEALGQVLHATHVSVNVHPDDRAVLDEALPELLAEFNQLERIKLTDDPAVGRGGCVVRHGQGRIDATIDTQLRRVVDAMLAGGCAESEESESGDERGDTEA